MNINLKRAIVDYIFNNYELFGLVNVTNDKFKAYIYDSNGEYLIGGKEVANFIQKVAKLV